MQEHGMNPVFGFDGLSVTSGITPGGDYARLVIKCVADAKPLSRLLVYTPKQPLDINADFIGSLHNAEFRLPPPQGFHGALWRSFGIANNLQADGVSIFHGLAGSLPININKTRIPTVVSIHDVNHKSHPQDFSLAERKLRDYQLTNTIRNADKIIAPSQFIKEEIIRWYNAEPDKISVIHQPCDESFRPLRPAGDIEAAHQKFNLPRKYILLHGAIDKSYEPERAVRALSALNPRIELVIIGNAQKGYKKRLESIAGELGITSRIHYYTENEIDDLPAVYQGANAILHTRSNAGSGVNILQGLESGRPLIMPANCGYEEFAGFDTLYYEPASDSDLISALNAVIFGGREIDEMALAAKSYTKRFTLSTFTIDLLNIYSELLIR